LIPVCVVSASVQADTSIYVFDPDQSTVVQSGGFAGVHETYPIEGQFQLTVDSDAGIASFDQVDANLTEPSGFLYTQSLGVLFNMTELAGTVVNDTAIEFRGKTSDDTDTDIVINLSFTGDSVHLTGETIPPPHSADFFYYNLDAVAQKKYGGGTGEPNAPYRIATAEDLMLLGESPEDYDKHFILTADIDLDPNLPGRRIFDRAVIAADVNDSRGNFRQGTQFTGVFDGNDLTISNMIIEGGERVGLFGLLGNGAEVRNLGVVGVNITGSGGYVGGLVGWNRGGSITASHSTGTVTGNEDVGGLVGDNDGSITTSYSTGWVTGIDSVGGLVGDNNDGSITTSYSTGTVSGDSRVGGLVGKNGEFFGGKGSISRSYSTGTVMGGRDVGGLVGYNYNGSITNSYSTGSVSGHENVGGLVGVGWFGYGILADCYSTGSVSGNEKVGGLVGTGDPTRVYNSVWDMETSGLTVSIGGVGLTTTEMMDPYMLGLNGFANDPNWVLDAGRDCPRLAWEGTAGQIIPEPVIDWLSGQGTEEEPYRIDTAAQLILLRGASGLWDRHFALGAGIDLDPNLQGRQVFSEAVIEVFSGVFDGNGHTISHLTIEGGGFLGLFGQLGPGAIISNLALEEVNVNGTGYFVGGLVGSNGTGWVPAGTISNCYSTGTVNGNRLVGGLVGYNGWRDGSITTSYSACTVAGEDHVGGLVGYNGGAITASYSTGSVMGNEDVGGLVGNNEGSITTSYSIGAVTGNENVGGLVGDGDPNTVSSSFWDIEISGQATSRGGTGATTAEMHSVSTYLDAGWDFVDEILNGTCDFWQISPGDYPRLRYCASDGPAMPEGLGTAEQPYLIRDARDLGTVWLKPTAHYRLETSLDLSGTMWSMAVVAWFGGTFDGNGHVISNLHIQGAGFLGLFGHTGSGARISNLALEAVDVDGTGEYIGSLVGWNDGSITTSYSTGSVMGNEDVGGLVGNNEGSITRSYSTGTVSADEDPGGLVGSNDGSITSSYSSSKVSGDCDVGGLVGDNYGSITTSYSTGAVSGGNNVGGLVGHNGDSEIATSYSTATVHGSSSVGGLVGNNDGSITICYSTGAVSATGTYVGGLVGIGWGDVNSSFWDVETSGQTTSDDGTGLPTAEMQTAKTFLEAGWDFVGETVNGTEDIWHICEGTNYPRFVWQIPVGDFVCPDGVSMPDFSLFATHWLDDDCDPSNDYCEGTDLDLSGAVDTNDLEVLADSWLAGVKSD